jgi:TatD DNase family protein
MLVDTHCHLYDPAYEDVGGTLTRASEHGVWGVIAVGADATSNLRTIELARGAGKGVWPAMGFHPEWVQLSDADLEEVEFQVATHQGRLVALGEVGLPWYSLAEAGDAAGIMARCRARFRRLLDLACRYDLPVVVHAPHGAAQAALADLTGRGVERAVFHWHKAPAEVTRAIVDAGYLVSVTPEVVYRDRDRELVETVPLTSLLVESDGPWPYRGEFEGLTSGPWLVGRVAEEVAKIKRLPAEEVMSQLAANACRLFDLGWM